MRHILHFASFLLIAGGAAFAQNNGYFAQGNWQTVPGGAAGTPGPGVTVVSINVQPGGYLLTAKVDGESYAPNSGASCFFTGPNASTAWDYTTVNTSSDWNHLQTATVMMLGKYVSTVAGTVTVTCQRGYTFTGASLMEATLSMTQVATVNPE